MPRLRAPLPSQLSARLFAGLLVAAALAVTPPTTAAQAPEQDSDQNAGAADRTTVRGRVVDGDGAAVAAANVWATGTAAGAVTDSTGRFTLRLAPRSQPYVLVASRVGYEQARASVAVGPSAPQPVRLVLQRTGVEIEEVVVSTSRFTSGLDEGVTLTPLDVVTTPGTSADVFRAIQTYPGVSAADAGSELVVRGGPPSETLTLIDHATVRHPYKYESPTTSTFGTLPPFLVQGTSFSAGGFSARYGNALSGVLDMRSQGAPEGRSVYANAGLAAASVGVDWPVVDDLGVRFSANRSFTGLLFRVNDHSGDFRRTPQSTEVNLNVVYDYSDTGTVKLFNFSSAQQMGVRVNEPSFSSIFRTDAVNRLHNLYWTDRWQRWAWEASASAGRFRSEKTFGTLDLKPRDTQAKLRVDAAGPLSDAVELRAGAEAARIRNSVSGEAPSSPVHSASDPVPVDYARSATRVGTYAEVKARLTRRLAGRVGLRADAHTLAASAVADPRASLRYRLSESTDVRVAWGLYHQFPDPKTFDLASPEEGLSAQQAQHVVAGAEHRTDRLHLRVEGYYKPYDDLVVQPAPSTARNAGDGWAAGGDVFLKYGAFLETPVYGRLAYSYLQSERRQPRRRGKAVVLDDGPSPYDVTHDVTLVLNATVPGRLPGALGGGYLSGGVTVRHATGAPVTPVVDAVPAPQGEYFLPVEGAVGSDRLPDYRRVDVQVNYYVPLPSRFAGDGSHVVIYAAVNNLLDRRNALGYRYSADYTERSLRETTFARSFYAGVTLTVNL